MGVPKTSHRPITWKSAQKGEKWAFCKNFFTILKSAWKLYVFINPYWFFKRHIFLVKWALLQTLNACEQKIYFTKTKHIFFYQYLPLSAESYWNSKIFRWTFLFTYCIDYVTTDFKAKVKCMYSYLYRITKATWSK
jgi:hypothetical protein